MSRRRSRARPGRKKSKRCAGCGRTLVGDQGRTFELFCIRCEAKREARAELLAKSHPRIEEKIEEKKMHIPSMGK